MSDDAREHPVMPGNNDARPATRQRARELFAKLVGDNDARASRMEGANEDPGPLTEADLEDLLRELRLGITARLSGAGAGYPEPAPVRVAMTVREPDATVEFHLDDRAVHRPRHFRLRNQGVTPLHVLGVTCNGDGLMGAADIRRWIDEGEPASVRELAFGLYLFCRRHQVHGPPPVARWEDPLIQDPPRFHAAYGYGLCGHSAHAFMGLCRLFGLRARIRGVRGHTFPEVHDDDGWHVVDPNGETWYPAPGDPAALLSLSDLARAPASFWGTAHFRPLGRGKTHEALFALLRDRERHRTLVEVDGDAEPEAERPLISLAPGETLTLHRDVHVPWASPRVDAAWLAPFVPPRNVRLMSITRSVRGDEFHAGPGEEVARFEYPLAKGWAGHDLSIHARPARPGGFGDAPPGVWLLTDRRRLGPFAALAPGHWRLGRGFAALDDDETGVTLRVECAPDSCEGLDLDVSYQYSVYAFPMPVPGANTLRVRVGVEYGMPDADAELGLAAPEAHASGGPPEPLSPRDEVVSGRGPGLEFRWSPAPERPRRPALDEASDMPHVIEPADPGRAPRADGHELLVTRSARRFDLAGPSFHRFVHGSVAVIPWAIVKAQLGTGSCHWRVRRVDADRMPLGRWSEPAAFRVTPDAIRGEDSP